MKRRIFSLAMAIIMALSLLPTTAFASVLGGGNVDGTTLADDMGGAAQTIFKTVLQSAAFETSAGLKIGTGDGTTTISGVNWKDEWFLSESLFYNHELARTAMALSAAAYVGANNMKSAYNAFGFDTRDSRFFAEYPVATKEDNDVVGHSFAIKEIYDPTIEDSRPLVVITVRGTPGNEEWYSNFNLGTEQYHDGFFTAEAKVLDNLNEYIEKMEELGYDMDSAKYLVTGHSRGAAVANILAASLTENSCAAQGDVFGYTFAAPAVAAYASENGYENIFNIVNPEDFVTQMPLGEGKWGYKRFGIDLVLPSRSYYAGYDNVYSKMALAYKDIIGKDFVPYQDGVQPVSKLTESIYNLDPTVNDFYTKKYPALYGDLITRFTCYEYFNMLADIIVTGNVNMKFVETVSHGAFDDITWFFISNYAIDNKVFSAHSQVAYLSWLRSCPAWELFGDTNTSSKRYYSSVVIAGPVDVYVYDEAGTLVAGGINEKVVNDTLAVSVKCGEKVVDLPKDQEYRIAIKARTAGTVKYTVEEKSVTGSVNTVNAVEFEEITIKRGDVLEGSIGVDTAAQEYSLTKNGETVIYPTGDREEPPEGDDKNAMFNINVDPAENGSADLSTKAAAKGDTVYITPVPDDGYMLSSLRMSAGDGSKVEVSKKANGDYAFVMPGAEVTIRVTFRDAATGPVNPVGPTDPVDPVNPTDPIDPAPGNPFDDVKAGAYYYGAVLWAVENGITTGTSQTTFSPNIVCTRAQAVTFLWRAAGSPVVSGVQNPFADIDKSAYYYNAVLWGVKNGIVKGTGDATFGPDDICSRGQIVTLQWRANGGQQVPGTNPFADVAMDAYYGQAVLWAVKEGITNGTSLTTFSPENTCSRGEIVTFLYRDAQ